MPKEERQGLLEVYNEYFNEVIIPEYGGDPSLWPEEARDKAPLWLKLERVARCEGNLLEFCHRILFRSA
jgi:hypothetical protein